MHLGRAVWRDLVREAVEAHVTKTDVSTHRNKLFTVEVRAALAADPDVVDTRRWLRPGNAAIGGEVARLLTLYPATDGA